MKSFNTKYKGRLEEGEAAFLFSLGFSWMNELL